MYPKSACLDSSMKNSLWALCAPTWESSLPGYGERLSMLQKDHPLFHPQAFHLRLQALQGLLQGFVGKKKRSPVNGNHVFGAALPEHLQRLFGGAVVRPEPVRLVGGYGEKGQEDLPVFPLFSENLRVSRVAGKKNGLPILGEEVAVVPAVGGIPGAAPPPVGGTDGLDPKTSGLQALIPIDFGHRGKARFFHEGEASPGDDQPGFPGKALQAVRFKMIIMGVGDEDEIQVLDLLGLDGRLHRPAGDEDAGRKIRVEEDLGPV